MKATDSADFIQSLNAGVFSDQFGRALSDVAAGVIDHGKGPKIDVFFFKAKENLKRKKGHRQPFTRLRVEKITVSRSRTKKESSDGA